MRQSIALWLLAWISLKVVLSPVSQLTQLINSVQIKYNLTSGFGSQLRFLCVSSSCWCWLVASGVAGLRPSWCTPVDSAL